MSQAAPIPARFYPAGGDAHGHPALVELVGDVLQVLPEDSPPRQVPLPGLQAATRGFNHSQWAIAWPAESGGQHMLLIDEAAVGPLRAVAPALFAGGEGVRRRSSRRFLVGITLLALVPLLVVVALLASLDHLTDRVVEHIPPSVEKQIGADNLAAVIIEPIQGEGGFIVPADGFLNAIVDWCRANGVVFIADEIQTGFCRTGDWFACDHEGVVPDLITTAKGIAGGLPLAAVTGRAELMDAVHPGGLGGTYGGNPVACAAALGAIEEMQTNDLPGRARQIERIFRDRLGELAQRYPAIGDLRGRGAMMAVELVRPGTKEPDPALTGAVARACHARGLVVLTAGSFGNVFRFLPPLSTSDDLLHEGLDVIAEAFAEVTGA